MVGHGGTLSLVGAKGVPSTGGVSWTHLKDAPGPIIDDAKVPGTGPTTLHLAKDVPQGDGAWKEDDWIAVATTSFSPFETEFVQIKSLKAEGGGTTIGLRQELKYYHFGSADPGPPSSDNFRADKTKNYGVDERAEVGLISRSIKLTAEIDPTHLHWGGELKILHGFASVTLQGVELEKFGKDRLGSYPIHLHEADAVATPLTVNANSVHHSLNKCVALHMTEQRPRPAQRVRAHRRPHLLSGSRHRDRHRLRQQCRHGRDEQLVRHPRARLDVRRSRTRCRGRR